MLESRALDFTVSYVVSYVHTVVVFRTNILNLKKSRDWSLLQNKFLKFNPYILQIYECRNEPKVGIKLYKLAS